MLLSSGQRVSQRSNRQEASTSAGCSLDLFCDPEDTRSKQRLKTPHRQASVYLPFTGQVPIRPLIALWLSYEAIMFWYCHFANNFTLEEESARKTLNVLPYEASPSCFWTFRKINFHYQMWVIRNSAWNIPLKSFYNVSIIRYSSG